MLSACAFQLHKNVEEISKFHNGLSQAERILLIYFAYETAARLRATELRALDSSGCTGICVEESISIIVFLVSHCSIFFFSGWMLWVLFFFFFRMKVLSFYPLFCFCQDQDGKCLRWYFVFRLRCLLFFNYIRVLQVVSLTVSS